MELENTEPLGNPLIAEIIAQTEKTGDTVEFELSSGRKLVVKKVKDAIERNRLARRANKFADICIKSPPKQWKPYLDEVNETDRAALLSIGVMAEMLVPAATQMQCLQFCHECGNIAEEILSKINIAFEVTSTISESAEIEEAKND